MRVGTWARLRVLAKIQADQEPTKRESWLILPMNKYFWYCNVCHAQNSREDGECQFCECEGMDCKRDNCSGQWHGYDALTIRMMQSMGD